jgi:hypothetical protein
VGTGIDVTERKRVEEERERLRQTQTYLAHFNRSLPWELTALLFFVACLGTDLTFAILAP